MKFMGQVTISSFLVFLRPAFLVTVLEWKEWILFTALFNTILAVADIFCLLRHMNVPGAMQCVVPSGGCWNKLIGWESPLVDQCTHSSTGQAKPAYPCAEELDYLAVNMWLVVNRPKTNWFESKLTSMWVCTIESWHKCLGLYIVGYVLSATTRLSIWYCLSFRKTYQSVLTTGRTGTFPTYSLVNRKRYSPIARADR